MKIDDIGVNETEADEMERVVNEMGIQKWEQIK